MNSSQLAPDALELPYRALFEAATDGVLVCTLEGRIVGVNPALCSMQGYTREELIGRDAATLVQVIGGEAIHVHRDGRKLLVEPRWTMFAFAGQRHRLGFFRDITERARAN